MIVNQCKDMLVLAQLSNQARDFLSVWLLDVVCNQSDSKLIRCFMEGREGSTRLIS